MAVVPHTHALSSVEALDGVVAALTSCIAMVRGAWWRACARAHMKAISLRPPPPPHNQQTTVTNVSCRPRNN